MCVEGDQGGDGDMYMCVWRGAQGGDGDMYMCVCGGGTGKLIYELLLPYDHTFKFGLDMRL